MVNVSMAATDSGPPEKKVDDSDILAVFKNRSEIPVIEGRDTAGKWELSSQEVAGAVNDRLGLDEDEGISRQAIHRRLEGIDKVVKVKHGRTVTWRLRSDRLVISSAGGSGGEPPGDEPHLDEDAQVRTVVDWEEEDGERGQIEVPFETTEEVEIILEYMEDHGYSGAEGFARAVTEASKAGLVEMEMEDAKPDWYTSTDTLAGSSIQFGVPGLVVSLIIGAISLAVPLPGINLFAISVVVAGSFALMLFGAAFVRYLVLPMLSDRLAVGGTEVEA